MDKHPIQPILEHYGLDVSPDRMGWVKVKCPFHGDTHASAAVNLEQNYFKCFACTMAGDTYKIIMEKEGLGFREAVVFAEGITGEGNIEISGKHRNGRRIPAKPRDKSGSRKYTPPRGRRGSNTRA
jgi:DNA primase